MSPRRITSKVCDTENYIAPCLKKFKKKPDEVQNCGRCKKQITNLKAGVLCTVGCDRYYHVECTRLRTQTNLSKMGVKKKRWKCDFCKSTSLQKEPQDDPKMTCEPVSSVQTPKNEFHDLYPVSTSLVPILKLHPVSTYLVPILKLEKCDMIKEENEIIEDVCRNQEKMSTGTPQCSLYKPDEVQNCGRCKKQITNLKAGVLCAVGCDRYYHVECTRLRTQTNLSKMGAKKKRWQCDFCRSASLQKEPKEEDEIIIEDVCHNQENMSTETPQCSLYKPDEVQNCGQCRKQITNRKAGVLCAVGCDRYYHVECTRLRTQTNLSKMGAKKKRWQCDFCKSTSLQKEPKNSSCTEHKKEE